MKLMLLETEKEFFYALRYTLQSWEGGKTSHLNCPLSRLREQIEHFEPATFFGINYCCHDYFDTDGGLNDCPCDHFGSCKDAVNFAWEWIEKKENEYENR